MPQQDEWREERIRHMTDMLTERYGYEGPRTSQIAEELHMSWKEARRWLGLTQLWSKRVKGHIKPEYIAVAVADTRCALNGYRLGHRPGWTRKSRAKTPPVDPTPEALLFPRV